MIFPAFTLGPKGDGFRKRLSGDTLQTEDGEGPKTFPIRISFRW